jgi:hypothetical protein
MVIAIIILGILLFISLFINFAMWFAIDKAIDNFIENNPTEAMKYYLKHNAEETYPCTLLLSIVEGAEFDGSAYDFSLYEKTGVIGLTEFKTKASSGKYEDCEGDPLVATLNNQIVYKMKDGGYMWDFTPLT